MELTREDVDSLTGFAVIEFGASWCGFCQAARPIVDRMLVARPDIRRFWIEDGKGKRLGRSFGQAMADAGVPVQRTRSGKGGATT